MRGAMKTKLFALLAATTMVPVAQAECVLQAKTVSQHKFVITQRDAIKRDVVPDAQGGRKCVVSFRVRIGDAWHQAQGEYHWDGTRPSAESCAVAMALAERDVLAQVSRHNVVSENVLVCSDDPDRKALASAHPGTVGDVSQFRPHPDYPKNFYHNGTQCRWFLETAYQNRDVRGYSGVICQLDDKKWVVVDRF